MTCDLSEICGGCQFRNLDIKAYQLKKTQDFARNMQGLNQTEIEFGNPIFITDGNRRRASFTFNCKKGQLKLGFNEAQSNNIVNCEQCALLTPKLNANFANFRKMVIEICAIPFVEGKGKKQTKSSLSSGDILVCEADNGIDVVFEFDKELNLDHRMTIFEMSQNYNDIIRISHRRKLGDMPETIVEKIKPIIKIADYDVYIPAGTFLQPSKAGETALVDLMLKYLGNTKGKIADLFCGVGTFSYPLSRNINNKILAVDSSAELLEGFRQSVNKNVIPNIEIVTKNLFKYPLDESELKGFDVVVFDPPRAGASAQVAQIATMLDKPKKLIAISCNPHSFIKDANILLDSGYKIQEITFVDQFIYSNHSELVALFTLK